MANADCANGICTRITGLRNRISKGLRDEKITAVFDNYHMFHSRWLRVTIRITVCSVFGHGFGWPLEYALASVVKVSGLLCRCKCHRNCMWTGIPDMKQNDSRVDSHWSMMALLIVGRVRSASVVYVGFMPSWVCDVHNECGLPWRPMWSTLYTSVFVRNGYRWILVGNHWAWALHEECSLLGKIFPLR